MEKVEIYWSDPVEIFKPGTYNTDEKFIEHLRKFVSESRNSVFEKSGIVMFLSGNIKPQERLSIVFIEGTFESTVKEKIYKRKGQVRELKCLYKNYKDENLYIKVGEIKDSKISEEEFINIVCSLIDYVSPSCNESCKRFEKVTVKNSGNFSPLDEIYGED